MRLLFEASYFSVPSQKNKPIAGPQRFVELVVVVDNTEVIISNLINLQLLLLLLVESDPTFVFSLPLPQYKRYESQTRGRILGVVNHVDKVSLQFTKLSAWPRALAALSWQFPVRSFLKHVSSRCSCIDLWIFASCWWRWRFGITKTTLTWTLIRKRLWTISYCGVRLNFWRGWSMTMPNLWREYQSWNLHRISADNDENREAPSLTWRETCVFNSGIDFDGDTVGLANKFAICTKNSSGVNQVRLQMSASHCFCVLFGCVGMLWCI